MRTQGCLPLFFSLLLSGLSAQTTTTLRGTVVSATGDTLAGANAWLAGTYDGATTGASGLFSFQTDATGSQILLVTYLGYDTFRQTLTLAGGITNVLPKLRENAASLGEVVISAGSFEAASDRRRAVVLSPLDIALTASATADIAGAIATLPGTMRNGESGQILVRGGAAYETRTFIDGLYVQNPYNSSVPNVPARNRFSPFLFKGVQFSTGGYSAEYGQALSSALILNSDDLPAQTTTGLSLMSVGGGLAHTQRWARTSLAVSANYVNLTPYFWLVPQTIDWTTAPQSGGGELIFRHQTSQTGILKGYLSANRSDMGMHYPDPFQPQETVPLRLMADNVYANTSYRDIWNDEWAVFAGAAYTHNRDQVVTGISNDAVQQSAQLRFTAAHAWGDNAKIKFGAEYLRGQFDETYRDGTGQHFGTLLNEHYLAGFVETEALISPKIAVRAGIRAEHSALLGRANIAPRLSAAYLLGKNEQVAFAYGQFFQTPEYAQMRFGTDLRFERATHLMANYQRIWGGYTFRAEFYHKTYDGLVKTSPDFGPANNNGSGYARGVDVFFRNRSAIRNGDYWVAYSYLDTRRDYRDFPGQAIPTFAAAHNASAVYKQWFPKLNMAFGATYAFQSPRPYHDPNYNGFNQGRTPAYHDLSINASYLTNIGGHFTILYVSATNLPGFRQVYGYQFGTVPDTEGVFPSRAIVPPAKHFLFVGLFINFGKQYKATEVTTNDL